MNDRRDTDKCAQRIDELKLLLSQLDPKIEHELENTDKLHILSLRMFALARQRQKTSVRQTPAGIAKALANEIFRLRLNRHDSE